jgi:hypothetical protein
LFFSRGQVLVLLDPIFSWVQVLAREESGHGTRAYKPQNKKSDRFAWASHFILVSVTEYPNKMNKELKK